MKSQLIAQGAEAKIFLVGEKYILKSRIPKSYRHPILDGQIRTRRTRSESKILSRLFSENINVPKVTKTNKFDLELEYIDGDKISEKLNSYDRKKQFLVMKKLGKQTAKLHDTNIIHGDLTTSNTILRNGEIFIIDFGLSFFSHKIEDKAVDLHLIKQALEAKHYQNHELLFENFLESYNPKEKDKIIQRLKTVENRGRYKEH
ncbi:MAG: KEOPS complex kinase/ATPase Bud32 [Nanoarchaeota archaeon]|nr:KEOPS complex kinase/ATPase Bud32 [Nanoarchaeota archaeon]